MARYQHETSGIQASTDGLTNMHPANIALLLHLAFILFVVSGGVLVHRWPYVAWVHLPAASWGVMVELTGWACPLTPLEDHLRPGVSYPEHPAATLERVLTAIIYPGWLTREIQLVLGIVVLVGNFLLYRRAWHHWRNKRRPVSSHEP